nr:formate/nitrite transporter family protein [Anaerolineae bacterium]
MATQAIHPIPIEWEHIAPPQIARRVEKAGIAKANLNIWTMFLLAILAGAFIALGAEFSTLTITGVNIGYGLTKLLGGVVFSLGLVLVVVAGAELFTGNNLLTIAWINGSASLGKVLRNWTVVFIGNLVGSLSMAGFMFLTHQWAAADYAVGATAIRIAADKATLPFSTALVRGILCNALVCLAVWLCFGARSVADKIAAIVFPISAFVASGFEHSVANMYFIPYGLLLGTQPEVVAAANLSTNQLDHLTMGGFISNLIPVTIGNLIGGAVLVGGVYWFVYLRNAPKSSSASTEAVQVAAVTRSLALTEGKIMTTNTFEPQQLPLFGYVIASGDAYYTEMGQRMIYLEDEAHGGYHISAEMPGKGKATAVDLSQVLLEYAMTCHTSSSAQQAESMMRAFGKRLGEKIADHFTHSLSAETPSYRAVCALECVLQSLNAPYTVEEITNGVQCHLAVSSLEKAAEQSGMWAEIEMAQLGLESLCDTLSELLGCVMHIDLPPINIDLYHMLSSGMSHPGDK